MAPDRAISERRNVAEKQRLAKMKAALSDTDKTRIVERAKALAERQVQEDDPEILPKVTLADVPIDMHIPTSESATIEGAPATLYAQGTNGIVYQHVVVDLPQLAPELQAVLPLYTSFAAELGSGGRDYLDTQNVQAAVTGGIGTYIMQRGAVDDEQAVKGYMVVRGKALLRNTDALSSLMLDTLADLRFDETSRIRELVAQSRAGREQSITGSGHMLAMMAAASGMSPTIRLSHQLNGLAGIKAIKALDDSLEQPQALEELCEKLAAIHSTMRDAPRQFMVVAEEENVSKVLTSMGSAFGASPEANSFDAFSPAPVREQSKQLWTTSTEVNFSAKAYPTVPSAHEDSAALSVLGPFLRNGFLHRAIRETGGAYGGGASQDSDTASFRFYSYRDPRLAETLADFDASIEWLQTNKHEERELEESILNVISGIDKPGSPAGEARSTFQAELFNRTAERRRLFRQRILEVSLDDLRRVGQTYFDPTKASTGVVTNESISKSEDVASLELDKHSL
jgi:Zn-dependent M16 (insulinase) family peptidase